ncbi:MAG: right-handed parallel beta-helix repeat-containing protein [Planctomycetaceae bacterium]|nr:right-handed parallel beta-helix repeat-containing protein [Planctomycetaceae bacterium]
MVELESETQPELLRNKDAVRVVASDGTGDFRTLQEAFSASAGANEINLQLRGGPFRFRGNETIRGSCSISGNTNDAPVVIECEQCPCFIVDGGTLTLLAVSVVSAPDSPKLARPLLKVKRGAMSVSSSKIQSAAHSGLEVAGTGASATIGQSQIMTSRGNALKAFDGATVRMDDCVISDSRNNAVSIESNAHVVMIHCTIEGGNATGINIRKGRLEATACNISRNGDYGIDACGGEVTLNNCSVQRNGSRGLWARDRVTGEIANCDFSENGRGANSIDETCRIHQP